MNDNDQPTARFCKKELSHWSTTKDQGNKPGNGLIRCKIMRDGSEKIENRD